MMKFTEDSEVPFSHIQILFIHWSTTILKPLTDGDNAVIKPTLQCSRWKNQGRGIYVDVFYSLKKHPKQEYESGKGFEGSPWFDPVLAVGWAQAICSMEVWTGLEQ